MARSECKYLVPTERLPALRQALLPFFDVDLHVSRERGEYTVQSIYFDTPNLDYYWQKVDGIQHRRKLRLRGYDQPESNAAVFLEIKRKDDACIAKTRVQLAYPQALRVLAGGCPERHFGAADPARLRDLQAFLYHLHRYRLLPVVLVRYEREAYFCRFDPSLRITLDKDLRSAPYPRLERLFGERRTRPSLRGRFVLEAKSHGMLPAWLRSILEEFGLERTAVSKYTISLDEHGIPQRGSAPAVFGAAAPLGHASVTAWLRRGAPRRPLVVRAPRGQVRFLAGVP
ncbi:MAG: polyphosphate polymerase domain-containing protein [Candidatus Latescibacterota bacterium]